MLETILTYCGLYWVITRASRFTKEMLQAYKDTGNIKHCKWDKDKGTWS